MRMVELENQRGAAEHRVQDLAKQHDLFSKSPEKVAQIMELLQRKQMLRTAQAMLLSRLQEVRIYEENAPAYYGVFAPADVDHIRVVSKLFKCGILVVGGTAAGTFGALGVVLLLGIADGKLRTPGEAAKAAGAPLLTTLAGGFQRVPERTKKRRRNSGRAGSASRARPGGCAWSGPWAATTARTISGP